MKESIHPSNPYGLSAVGTEHKTILQLAANSMMHEAAAEARANASLIAAAFNAATEVEDMGFNGLEAIKVLAALLRILEGHDAYDGFIHDELRALLARLKGGSDDNPKT